MQARSWHQGSQPLHEFQRRHSPGESIFAEHSADAGIDLHVFSALYRVGLLGCVQHDRVRGQWQQHFLRPGEATLEPIDSLPLSSHYLLHPVLSDAIGRINPAFLRRVDRDNIVGYDRPWRDPGTFDQTTSVRLLCVLKADVHGFGGLMRAGADGPVRKALEEAVARWAPPGAITETGAGDAALIADEDPAALAQTARYLMDRVFNAPSQRGCASRSTTASYRRGSARPTCARSSPVARRSCVRPA